MTDMGADKVVAPAAVGKVVVAAPETRGMIAPAARAVKVRYCIVSVFVIK